MDKFDLINKFFELEPSENLGNDIFLILKNIVNFDSAYIYFNNPDRIIYSTSSNGPVKPYLKEELKIKNTTFGYIILTGKFSKEDKQLFKTCALIIAGIIKEHEISKIIKMQSEALQNGYIEMAKANKMLKQSEEIKSKFISHISHELRTPLNSILGFSDLLELAGTLNEKQTEFVNDIKVSGLTLLGMINEILDMSKIEAGSISLNRSEFKVEQVIFETINILKPLLYKKNIRLIQDVENFTMRADFQKIQQILFNLLSNAIKFTPENGEITLAAGAQEGKVILSVIDTGIGIAKKDYKRIFEKFEQLDGNMSNSTGLGLAITKELVKLHGGEIKVKSVLNKGSNFTVIIPNIDVYTK